MGDELEVINEGINCAIHLCYNREVSAGWYTDLKTGKPLKRNKGEQFMLMVSEIAEAMEGERKNLMDSHIPSRPAAEVELADCLIRIFGYAGANKYDLAGALLDKLEYNLHRADHKPENRIKENGKKF